ncbi:kinetochore complex Sim4 subunit Fta1 domain-containing protein [Trichoderma austrokoningii]
MARQKTQKAGPAAQPSQGNNENEAEAGEVAISQFFNTTFSTHRVSPLFIGAQKLDQARLDRLAHRLRDTLVGDVVRGVQIGLEATDTPMGQVGPLKAVTFRWFQAEDILGDQSENWGELSDEQKRGLWIEMRHENAAYVALLLPGFSRSPEASGTKAPAASLWNMGFDTPDIGEADGSQFLRLPLLLLRMPQALKSVIGEWLSTTFDCRVTKLNLGTRTLVSVLESWIPQTGLPRANSDLVLTLAFNAPVTDPGREAVLRSDGDLDEDEDEAEATEPGLRSMEISISASDLRRFLRAGKALQKSKQTASNAGPGTALWERDDRERRRLAGSHRDDGWAWLRNKDGSEYPLMEALASHLNHHMALNLFHPGVRVIQVSCGGFVLAQSRIKIVKAGDVTDDLSRAAWMFVTLLGERVQSDALSLGT